MTSKVSDGDKLVASIKRTRSTESTADKPASAPVAKKASRSAVAKKKAAPKKPDRAPKQALIDLFQHGRRVWPD